MDSGRVGPALGGGGMSEAITRDLAEYVTSTELGDLPERVAHESVRAFVNFVGCALGGSRHPAFSIARAAARMIDGGPQAGVLGTDGRTDVANAAFLNCFGSAVHTFDDTHLASIVHPTGPVAAAALAVAEHRTIGGAEFLNSLVLGIETTCRVGSALMVHPGRADLNLYMTGLAGVFGAAVAVGKLLRLGRREMVHALGIASSEAAGLREMHGTMCSAFVPAQAARNGLWAALLAAEGLDSSERAFEGPKGFGAVFGRPANLAAITSGLGTRFEIQSNSYKAYPCGIAIHPAIDACLDLARDNCLDHRLIEHCDLRVHPLALGLTGRMTPATGLEAQVSIYHWVAAALVHGAAGLAQASDDCARDPAVVAMRERVAPVADPGCAPDEASAVITLRDKRTFAGRATHCRGSIDRPLTDEELARKFLAQADAVLGTEPASRLLELCRNAAGHEDMGAIGRAAKPAAS